MKGKQIEVNKWEIGTKITAFIFLFSALAKLFSIQQLIEEKSLVYNFPLEWIAFGMITLILFEVILSILLWRGNVFALLSSIILLFAFNTLLLYERSQNIANCGCFGTWFILSPKESIVKNCILIATLVYSFFSRKT